MTQRNVETVIGKLVADEDLRGLFRKDPKAAVDSLRAQGYELSDVEAAALAALAPERLSRLASSLDPRLRKASLKVFLGLLLLFPPAARAMTLDEAIATAFRANPDVRDAELALEQDEHAIEEIKTHRLPSFEFQGLVGRTLTPVNVTVPAGSLGDFAATGPIPSSDVTLEGDTGASAYVSSTITQPLTQLHEIGLKVDQGRTSREIDREALRAKRAEIAHEVRSAWYGILEAQGLIEASVEKLALLRETERLVGEQLAVEAVLPGDALDVRAAVAAEEARLIGLRDREATLREQLNDLLARDLSTPFDVEPLPEVGTDDATLESARERALADRAEIRKARLAAALARTELSLVRAESIPQLALALSYSSFVGVDLLPRNVAQAGLQIRWEPFDWGRRAKRRAQAQVKIERAEVAARSAESRIALDVGRAFRALRQAKASLEATRLAREAAVEKARVAGKRHGEEASLTRDLLEAKANLADADAQYRQALSSYWTARSDFDKTLGKEY